MNTKNMVELEQGFQKVLADWETKIGKLDVEYGIYNGHVKLEDGLPWLEVSGKFTKAKAKQFLQDLANELDIKMLFNRLEIYPIEDSVLHGVFDLNPEDIDKQDKNLVIRSYCDNEDSDENESAIEFMEDYGQEIIPKNVSKKPKVK